MFELSAPEVIYLVALLVAVAVVGMARGTLTPHHGLVMIVVAIILPVIGPAIVLWVCRRKFKGDTLVPAESAPSH